MQPITRYPHAHYDAEDKFGYLLYYYPYDAVKDEVISREQWRKNSWSPEVLNFKEGGLEHIKLFVTPFLSLIRFAANPTRELPVYLVPAPSSTPKASPKYSTVPRNATNNRNRDDRNVVFCQQLIRQGAHLKLADILVREKPKQPKEHWSAEQHAASMKIDTVNVPRDIPPDPTIVVVDDVSTDRGTLLGCEMLLEKRFKGATVIKLSLGLTRDPHNFEGLN